MDKVNDSLNECRSAFNSLKGYLEALDAVVRPEYIDRLHGHYLRKLEQAIVKEFMDDARKDEGCRSTIEPAPPPSPAQTSGAPLPDRLAGRTADFESANDGSTPSPASNSCEIRVNEDYLLKVSIAVDSHLESVNCPAVGTGRLMDALRPYLRTMEPVSSPCDWPGLFASTGIQAIKHNIASQPTEQADDSRILSHDLKPITEALEPFKPGTFHYVDGSDQRYIRVPHEQVSALGAAYVHLGAIENAPTGNNVCVGCGKKWFGSPNAACDCFIPDRSIEHQPKDRVVDIEAAAKIVTRHRGYYGASGHAVAKDLADAWGLKWK